MEFLQPDYRLRVAKLQSLLQRQGIEALVVVSNVNLLYVCGEVFAGLAFIPREGEPQFFIRRPQLHPESATVHYVRKIEQIAEHIDTAALRSVALELDEQSYSDIQRQRKIFPDEAELHNATALLREARMVKTPLELEQIREGARHHIATYATIPSLYRDGMTDRDLQIEIEREMRRRGSIGIFRCFGSAMEIYMGSLLTGDNAGAPSPYDFALGGAGSQALPLGSNGTPLREEQAVMIDMAGNYGVYCTDMTRTYSIGRLSDEAYRLHELSLEIHRQVMQKAAPGTSCADLYNESLRMVEEAGASPYFMGTELQAQFVGHGLGLQINELPVLMGRSKDTLQPGMIIAFEPKFVLPHIGAVGIENTYLVTETGIENLTPAPEEIIDLTQR